MRVFVELHAVWKRYRGRGLPLGVYLPRGAPRLQENENYNGGYGMTHPSVFMGGEREVRV